MAVPTHVNRWVVPAGLFARCPQLGHRRAHGAQCPAWSPAQGDGRETASPCEYQAPGGPNARYACGDGSCLARAPDQAGSLVDVIATFPSAGRSGGEKLAGWQVPVVDRAMSP